jgi:type IV pilus assembly protein PilX
MKKQRGSSLLLTLLVLIAMLISVVALMKSTSTASMVSGNLAFRDASMHAADFGMAAAIRAVNPCGAAVSSPTAPCGKVSDAAYVLNSMQPVSYFFNNANWNVATAHLVDMGAVGTNPVYEVKYIVDRLSSGVFNMQNSAEVKQHSLGVLASDTSPSNDYSEIGVSNTLLSVPAVFYRITVRVTGPSNTEYMSQTSLTVKN